MAVLVNGLIQTPHVRGLYSVQGRVDGVNAQIADLQLQAKRANARMMLSQPDGAREFSSITGKLVDLANGNYQDVFDLGNLKLKALAANCPGVY